MRGKPEEALTCNFHGILENIDGIDCHSNPYDVRIEAAFGKVRPPPLFQQTGVL